MPGAVRQRPMTSLWIRAVLAVAAWSGLMQPASAQAQPSPPVVVFAAASLKNAMDSIAARFGQATGVAVAVSYGGSPAMARQIEQGAPADVVLLADLDWMDYLAARGQIRPETRRNLLGNDLVLVAPLDRTAPVDLTPGALASALAGGRLAVANVESVPAGKYAKAALQSLGVWNEVSGRLAEAENVRAALAFVARGEAPLGIVYGSDARSEPGVRVAARFPAASHPPIIYPVALTAASRSPQAQAFLDALRSPEARADFTREGFQVLD